MSDFDLELLDRYSGKGLLVDANLLLLHFIGSFDRKLISRFKRTDMFLEEDFDLLNLILERSKRVVTTPNILTEVSSFSNQLAGDLKPTYFAAFATMITQLEEVHVASSDIARTQEFRVYGLTDAVITHLARDRKYLVLTTDGRLAAHLRYILIDVINFNQFRTFY